MVIGKICTFIIVCFLFASCSKEFVVTSFYECDGGLTKDSTKLTSALEGSWKLKEVNCGFCSEEYPRRANKLVIVSFRDDNTFEILEETESVGKGSWNILTVQEKSQVIIEGNDSNYLGGSINVCDIFLYADLTNVDGLGHLYQKID